MQNWNPRIRVGSTIILCSPRRSGKTIFASWLVLNQLQKRTRNIVVFTSGINMSAWFFAEHVYTGFYPGKIEKILEHQKDIKNRGEDLQEVVIVLDDLLTSIRSQKCNDSGMMRSISKYDDTLLKLFTTGRHYKVTLILISQRIQLIGLNFLTNCDIFVFFRFPLKRDRKVLIEMLGQYASEKEIEDFVPHIPDQYQLFVFQMLESGALKLDNVVFKFRVPEKFVKNLIKLQKRINV